MTNCKSNIKEIKQNRLTPEEKILIEITENMYHRKEKNGKFIYWYSKSEQILFEQDYENMILWVSHETVLSHLLSLNNHNDKIVYIITNFVGNYFGWYGFTPY